MPKVKPGSIEADRINAALSQWRQGDLALDEQWFVHVGDEAAALTDLAAAATEPGPQALASSVAGLVMVSQTCDVVRDCLERPYVELSPLEPGDPDTLREARRGSKPRFSTVPAAAERGLVADLDRVMTVEKSVVAGWARTPGFTTDAEARSFAWALARKRQRFAFPNRFTLLAKKLRERLVAKHGKNSPEGRALQALREIRVLATPHWDANPAELFFWFVRNPEEVNFEGKSWDELLDTWLNLVPAAGPYHRVDGQVVTLHDMTAADYEASDRLDLDHLSTSPPTS